MLAAEFVTANEIHIVMALTELPIEGVREALNNKLKNRNLVQFRRSLSHVQLFETTWTAALQASLSITNYQFTQTHVH